MEELLALKARNSGPTGSGWTGATGPGADAAHAGAHGGGAGRGGDGGGARAEWADLREGGGEVIRELRSRLACCGPLGGA